MVRRMDRKPCIEQLSSHFYFNCIIVPSLNLNKTNFIYGGKIFFSQPILKAREENIIDRNRNIYIIKESVLSSGKKISPPIFLSFYKILSSVSSDMLQAFGHLMQSKKFLSDRNFFSIVIGSYWKYFYKELIRESNKGELRVENLIREVVKRKKSNNNDRFLYYKFAN